jgi:hypothetical protein
MEKEFNETKDIIDKSIIEEKEKWQNSYENSFNNLLNIIGHSKDEYYNKNNNEFKNEKNKMKKFGYESKIFNTIIGSYIHFKDDILLFEQLTEFNATESGKLIDVYFEENTIFYNFLNKITLIFKEYCMNIIKNINILEIKNNLLSFVENKLKTLFIAYENINDIIKYQKENINNEKKQKLIENMFYYNKEKKQYDGWYVDLYRKNETYINYNLKIYAHNYCISKPIPQLNFRGSIIYAAMNYPEYGLITIEDKFNKVKKLYIMSFYSGNEYPHGWSDKIDYDSLKRIIIKR